jgi:hypothetical protein
MGTRYDAITDRHRAFIEAQPVFFVATAAPGGRVNLSPKGLDSLRVLGPNQVAWLNVTGSGNETAAHLLESPRMTVMFCSFVREPMILRLYGTARGVHAGDFEWDELVGLFPPRVGARQVFVMDVDLVQKSCGYAVPLMDFVAERTVLDSWASKKGVEGLAAYRQEKNVVSLDGMPTRLEQRRP